ncbi:histamine N-methyltransferase-like [Saccoglossus kowalevskii]|uniref:Histamine N-methyltransferase-like n=1 Tax=Saccoglossus kowalevskii TaxID=10224 RepID=A0ABM0GZU1_SACKO|nr:PREDICTED: histamine N-methyltransferase-like [Saccoglossus kowalevskii]
MKEVIKTLNHYPMYYHAYYDTLMATVDVDQRKNDVMTVVKKLKLDGTKALNVLTIGCGNGKSDEPFIDNLLANYLNISYTAVEPVADELTKFEQLVKNKGDQWNNVTFDFRAITIEEYLEMNERKQFGMIIAAHSAYHFKDVECTILDLYNCLDKGGILFTRMDDGAWEKLSVKVGEYYTDPGYNCIGTRAIEDIINSRLTTVRYGSIKRELWLDVTECFDEESQVGSHIIDFLTQIYNFREIAKPEIKKQILEYMRDECCKKEENKVLFSKDEKDLFIFRD